MRTVFSVICLITLAIAIASGCSGKKVWPKAPVTGRVTFQGRPLNHGRIVFVHEQGHGGASDIGPDGRYSLDGIIGNNRVAIECNDPNAKTTEPGRPTMAVPLSLIPLRYKNHMQSGFSAEVREGENTADFDLKP